MKEYREYGKRVNGDSVKGFYDLEDNFVIRELRSKYSVIADTMMNDVVKQIVQTKKGNFYIRRFLNTQNSSEEFIPISIEVAEKKVSSWI